MKELTCYGECPSCGIACQPDLASGDWENGCVEYAWCCDCRIIWEYTRPADDGRVSHYEVWKPENVISFEDAFVPYECEG